MQNEMYYQKHVFICTNQKESPKTCCANADAKEAFKHIKERVSALGLVGSCNIRISQSGCLGRCALGPCVVIYPEGRWYSYSSLADLEDIIVQDLEHGEVVNRLLIGSE